MPIFVDFKNYFVKRTDEFVSFCPDDRMLTRFFKCRSILFLRFFFLPMLPIAPRRFSQCSLCNHAFVPRRVKLELITGIGFFLSGILMIILFGYMLWDDMTRGVGKSHGLATVTIGLTIASLAVRAGWKRMRETLSMKSPSLHAQLLYASLLSESRLTDGASIMKYLQDSGIPKGEIDALLFDKTKIWV